MQLSKCTYACIHTYIHTYIHAYIHTCIHTYMHTCTHTYMHTCTHTYVHTCIQVVGQKGGGSSRGGRRQGAQAQCTADRRCGRRFHAPIATPSLAGMVGAAPAESEQGVCVKRLLDWWTGCLGGRISASVRAVQTADFAPWITVPTARACSLLPRSIPRRDFKSLPLARCTCTYCVRCKAVQRAPASKPAAQSSLSHRSFGCQQIGFDDATSWVRRSWHAARRVPLASSSPVWFQMRCSTPRGADSLRTGCPPARCSRARARVRALLFSRKRPRAPRSHAHPASLARWHSPTLAFTRRFPSTRSPALSRAGSLARSRRA